MYVVKQRNQGSVFHINTRSFTIFQNFWTTSCMSKCQDIFENITENTVFNLTKLKLKSLVFLNNKINEKLTCLRHLEISQNKELKPEKISRSINSLNKSVIEKLKTTGQGYLTIMGFVSTAVMVKVLYKSRWHIRYWIHLLHARRRGYTNLDEDIGFDYDCFVIYRDGDEDWVHNILLPKLWISPFELRVCQDRFLNSDNIFLVLIMLQEIGHRHLISSSRALITTTTYASWTEDDVGQVQFWEQVVSSMA
ncbi:hypothetical protein KUTeg_021707 [Tegillarca granosa]|uniref:TIR domain-containing protein n=1 Tax=Tegillarca granosa TaxID=220873 RepID=A0ABQ9E461_TEGGR|nr:hypothetical protein KUTeg_021707 [Tegillarca granosa]